VEQPPNASALAAAEMKSRLFISIAISYLLLFLVAGLLVVENFAIISKYRRKNMPLRPSAFRS
jgi:hypothetical protein